MWSSAGGQLIIMSRLGPPGHQRRFVQNLINSSKKISPVSTTRWGAGHHTFPWTACLDHRQTQRISFREGDRTLLCVACSETKLSGFITVNRRMAKNTFSVFFRLAYLSERIRVAKRWPCLYLEVTRINLHMSIAHQLTAWSTFSAESSTVGGVWYCELTLIGFKQQGSYEAHWGTEY